MLQVFIGLLLKSSSRHWDHFKRGRNTNKNIAYFYVILGVKFMFNKIQKSLLTIVCSHHLEIASSEKAIVAAQQNLLNSFTNFLKYIFCHILSLASKTGGRCVPAMPLSLPPH